MSVIDYNGEGRWSRLEILARYARYAAECHIQPRDIAPLEQSDKSGTKRIYPVMERVIAGIAAGDRACIALGIEFIEDDAKFTFGKSLKANTARALRRANLTGGQKDRIRRRVLAMLRDGHVPHEYREYAKLLRQIGFNANDLAHIAPKLNRDNPYVLRFFNYFEQVLQGRN